MSELTIVTFKMVSTQDSGSGNAVIPSTGGVATQKPERQTSETRGTRRQPRQVVLTSC